VGTIAPVADLDRIDRIDRVAREAFGYRALRAGQREAVEAALAGRDALVVMATGSGKSAIYQIAALLTPGPTIVVSPLIALQRDQVAELEERRAGGAVQLNSTLTAEQRDDALADLREGAVEFVYLAPEQLSDPELLTELRDVEPSLFVVDEAHCISEWGHDFRPDYLRLGAVAEELGRPPVLALTATAAPPVRQEIVTRLNLRDPVELVRGFDRPNIHLAVERFHDERRKRRALLERVAAAPRPGLLYVATRAHADELADALREAGVGAAAYHAGLPKAEREQVQERFMADELDAVVATTAFGMGVDKANVRWVFHDAPADSLDAYYQEIGRGGRDGERAEAVLFYRSEDLGVRRYFAAAGQVEADELLQVAQTVHEDGGPMAADELREAVDLSRSKLSTALTRLADAGVVELTATGEVAPADGNGDIEAAAHSAEDRRAFERSRLDMMRAYAEADTCRREVILTYFGEPYEGPCGFCDVCERGAGAGAEVEADQERPFPLGDRVVHREWGPGVVQRYEPGQVIVLFDTVGWRTLALDVVVERALLTAAAG
jgi:ATP-dependent DNA helicase RecQ